MTAPETHPASEPSGLERVLSVVTEVRPGEGITALLLSLDVFLLLTAYYVVKPVREGLILAMPSGAEYKAYLSAAIAVSLLVVVPLYGRLADRVAKHKLVVGVTLFFASHLAVFYALSATGLRAQLGLVFFVWVGIFNMMLVAQFWAFANDLYTDEQGKRLFALVGIGASAGSVVGASVTKILVKPLGTYSLMLVSAAALVASAGVTWLVAARERDRIGKKHEPSPEKKDEAHGEEGTFALVFRQKYLTMIALFSVLFTFVNTNGEYMLGVMVSAAAKVASAAAPAAEAADVARDYSTGFYGGFFIWVNVLVVLLQTFAVSRLVKFGGLKLAFFVLPVVALLDASSIALLPILAVLRIGKIAENAVDYSVNNTTRNMLWLPTSTAVKYKAKQAVDTFFVRMGDVASAGLVALGARRLGWPVRAFAIVDVVAVVGWLFVARAIVRENERRSEMSEA